MLFGKRKLREQGGVCNGVVVKFRPWGLETPARVTVEYRVDGKTYSFKENLTVVHHAIKVGKIPIGQRATLVMGDVAEGDMVAVCYNPAKPSKACLRDNTGVFTQ